MKSKKEISEALNAIRAVLDVDIIDVNIEEQQRKLLNLTQLIGLSAECKASARKLLHQRELQILIQYESKNLSPMVMNRYLTAECADEHATLEYSDRINSGVIHTCDSIRSVISLYKEELKHSLNG